MGKQATLSEPARAVFLSVAAAKVTGQLHNDPQSTESGRLGDLVRFAHQLVEAGMQLVLAKGTVTVLTSCHVSQFEPWRVGDLTGDAVRLHGADRSTTWQVTVHGEADASLCVISLTFDIAECRAPAPVPPDPAPPSPIKGTEPSGTLADKRREQIAAAASDVIARKGFANATMREIADAAGLHVPTMYQYVASKDEMLELVYSWTMLTLRTDVAQASAGCATPTAKLKAVIAALVEKSDRYRHRIGALNRELKSLSLPARTRVLVDYRRFLAEIADLVSEGIAANEFRALEPDIVANFIEASTDIWALRHFAVGRFGHPKFRDQITDLILQSLRRSTGEPMAPCSTGEP